MPVKVDYELSGQRRAAVLETVTPGPFGHEHMADRAQILLWSHAAFNQLPRHVRSLDVEGFSKDGALLSLGNVEEFFILNEFVPGDGYYQDLERLRDGADLQDRDLARTDALCDFLVGIHQVRGPDPTLYVRRLRELVGHHECIMGILDSYPAKLDGLTAEMLKAIEHACIDWRWRLKGYAHRLRQVHGDFHPWNILFQHDAKFRDKIWDQAAGTLIIKEAGGQVTDMRGAALDFGAGRVLANNEGVIASNGPLHDAVLDALRRVTGESPESRDKSPNPRGTTLVAVDELTICGSDG